MSIQTIWKRLLKNNTPLLLAMSLFRHPPFNAKPYIKFANFCTAIAATPSTIPGRGVATEFLLKKCGLTDEDITKAFRHCKHLLRAKSCQNLEEVLGLLNGCGLTTPAQIRRVVFYNPNFLFYKAERNIKSKLTLFRTFMKEEDIAKLLQTNARIFNASESRLKSAISLLQKLGFNGEELSELLARQPRLLVISEEKVLELFKQANNFGFKKGSKMFAHSLRAISGAGKENLDRKLQLFRSLGFSEKQVLDLSMKRPMTLELSEEKIKRNVHFVVNIVGLPLAVFVKRPNLFAYSLEARMIPRYRVMEALNSMQIQVLKRGNSFLHFCWLTEKCFLEKCVDSNAGFSSVLRDIYKGGEAGKLIIDKGTCCECVSVKNINDSCDSSSAATI